uniref:Metalloendopeptidase n=1 Tax=Parasteatoda tepidariorum TaxID=114398 RepID=A0A2L2XYJ7_PARTP
MASTLILFILFIGCSCGHPIDDYDPINFPMENPDLFGGDMLGFDSEDRSAVVDKRQLWERGVVPFVEDPGLNKTVIMLYGSLTFSKDWRAKLRTMETLDGGWLKDPMSKGKLSQKDIQRINMLYKCP